MALANNFEGGTEGATPTVGVAGNTSGLSGDYFDEVSIGSGNTVTFAAASTAVGKLGLSITTGVTVGTSYVGWIRLPVLSDHFGRVYFSVAGTNTGSIRFIRLATSAAQTVQATVQLTSGNHIALLDSTGATLATSSMVLSLNKIYRIEYHVFYSLTVGQITARIYDLDATNFMEQLQTAATANTGTQAERVRMGNVGSTFPQPNINLDDVVAAASDWPGPSFPAIMPIVTASSWTPA